MAGYSFLRLRPFDNESKTTAGDNSPGFFYPGFFYPPLPHSNEGGAVMSSVASPPISHPYQLGGLSSPIDATSAAGTSNISHTASHTDLRNLNASDFDSEKPAESHVGHSYTHEVQRRSPITVRRPRSHRDLPLLTRLRPLFMLIIFLPIPPLLSLLYMLIGHAILRRSHPLDPSWKAPLLSSVESGALGGVILSLPLALLIYLIAFPTKQQSSSPEDFFEDDESLSSKNPLFRYSGYAVCLVLVVCIGGAAGPLGVTCIGGAEPGGQMVIAAARKTLTTGKAAVAGSRGFCEPGISDQHNHNSAPIDKVRDFEYCPITFSDDCASPKEPTVAIAAVISVSCTPYDHRDANISTIPVSCLSTLKALYYFVPTYQEIILLSLLTHTHSSLRSFTLTSCLGTPTHG
ncbi:hypothetical protein BDQ12DRAFT_725595 [Crucibulum laeve]|uniref:Uncharacterized protein n=1 Tax=Crucibulum laeve TaxID=68775 RepID=A0A5C3LTB7_9AGAR|nr:hypothetical protein BDQ12DRAFT_725595 [Crucibulum laeve]